MADRPQQPARPARERKVSPVKTGYLVLYNAVSTILWATILGRVSLVASVHGTKYVFPAVGEFAKWTQTLALLEVVHAALGKFAYSLKLWFGKRWIGASGRMRKKKAMARKSKEKQKGEDCRALKRHKRHKLHWQS
ncbi:unnamed protein product [Aureobasidium uvarum]|uniref:Very-long-chain (3R)-3-hydroxyacyl-CoA dehydratase n=1 Tax=Aureobasidium uvarum TaxID=2773716 RepID=A0A9N8PUU0_9PEZI|nr:unnamed protein product [Aureobasidium uvarum]